AQVPKAKRHDHLPGAKGYFNATALQGDAGSLWVCEGAFDALALLAAGVPRAVAIFGVQGWRWDWAREVRELVFALDADTTGQQQWRQLARQAALRGQQVAVLEPAAYGGCKDASAGATGGGSPVAERGRQGKRAPSVAQAACFSSTPHARKQGRVGAYRPSSREQRLLPISMRDRGVCPSLQS